MPEIFQRPGKHLIDKAYRSVILFDTNDPMTRKNIILHDFHCDDLSPANAGFSDELCLHPRRRDERKIILIEMEIEYSFDRSGYGNAFFDRRHPTASSTSSTCPFTFTFGKTAISFPFSSITNVERTMPIYFLPYIDFSCQTP